MTDFVDFVAAGDNPLGEAIASDEHARATSNLSAGLGGNPEASAKALQVGKQLGIPREAVESDAPAAERQAKLELYRDVVLPGAPITKRHVADNRDFGAIYADRLREAAQMEALAKKHGVYKPLEGEKVDWSSLESVGRLAKGATIEAFGIAAAKSYYGGQAVWHGLMGETAAERTALGMHHGGELAQALLPQAQTYAGQAVVEGVQSLSATLPSVGAFALNPAAGLAMFFGQTQTETYGKYRNRGGSVGEAMLGSVAEGTIEAGTERIPMGFLVKQLGRTGMKQFIAGFFGREVASELMATHAQDAVDTAIANPNATWTDYANSRVDATFKTFVSTLVAGGFFTGMHAMARNTNNALSAIENGKHLNELASIAELSKMSERDPSMFAQFLQAIHGEQGSITEVHLPAAMVQEAISKGQIDPARFAQDTLAPLAEQAELNGDIAIPIGEYITGIATSAAGKALVEQARTHPEGMTVLEGETYMQAQEANFAATAADLLQKHAADKPFHEGAQAVHDQVLEQLSGANRFTADVNTAYAAMVRDFYAVLSHRMGVTPDQAFARYQLKVQAASVVPGEGETKLTQSKAISEYLASSEANRLTRVERQQLTAVAEGRPVRYAAQGRVAEIVRQMQVQQPELIPEKQLNEAVAVKATEISQKHGVHMGAWMDKGSLYLGMITVPTEARGKGVGSAAMRDLTAFADEQQLTSRLIPSQLDAEGTTSVEDLQRFYSRFGFTPELDKQGRATGYMTRPPQGATLDFTLQQSPKQERGGRKRVGGVSAVRHEIAIETIKGVDRYVGGPDYVNLHPRGIQHGLAEMMAQLRALALEGTRGKLWYEKSGAAILDMVGGDKKEARKIAGLIAIYSPNNSVVNNTVMALNAYYQHLAGMPIEAGFKGSNAKAEELMHTGKMPETPKVFSFFQNLMAEIDPAQVVPNLATMDLWMAISMGYNLGGIDQGTQYGFAEGRIKEIADELGWHPHQVQAAVWVAMRGRVTAIKSELYEHEIKIGIRERNDDGSAGAVKPDKKAAPTQDRNDYNHFKLAREWGLRKAADEKNAHEASLDFSDMLQSLRTQIAWEATPSKDSGVLAGIHSATIGQKEEYLKAVMAATTEGGVDLIAKAVGLPPGRLETGFGAWEGDMGMSAQRVVPVAAAGQGAGRELHEGAQKVLTRYAALRAYVFTQDQVLWNAPVYDAAETRKNGIEIRTARPLTHEEGALLYDRMMYVFGHDKIAPAFGPEGGAQIVNVLQDKGLPNKDRPKTKGFHGMMDEVLGLLPAHFGGGVTESVKYRSMFGSVENNWKENPDGESLLEVLRQGGPDLLAAAADLRARVQAVNADFAGRYGWDARRFEQSSRADAGDGVGAGDQRMVEAAARADRAAAGVPALANLPRAALTMPDGTLLVPGPFGRAHEVASAYMHEAGMEYTPPHSYVTADGERAARIAAEYDAMQHAPDAPEVKASYDAMIDETVAQYKKIVEMTGLKVEFADFKTQGDPYQGNPRLMMVDVIERNHMWVFSTRDGFGGDATFDPSQNPLLRSTEIMFGDKPALANDVFRAVHDYFGHLMHGNGFRASGEENAWRSHAEMYSDAARGAMTSETRGQNSWLNFGPHGAKNRNAKVEDTTFADQKTGLMAGWTWEEGRDDEVIQLATQRLGEAIDAAGATLAQEPEGAARAEITLPREFGAGLPAVITLLKNADLSSFIHESGHFFLEVMLDAAEHTQNPELQQDVQRLMGWFGVEGAETWRKMTTSEKRPHHEKFARGFEAYMFEGRAPAEEQRSMFAKFRAWMVNVYKTLDALNVQLTEEVRGVFGRMIASEKAIRETEQLRGMEPLFKTPEEAGYTPEQWREYQMLGQAATEEGVRALERSGIRDMAWTRNAKSKALRSIHKGVVEKRAAMQAEVQAELEAVQVYRAIRLLKTGELDGRKLPDHKMSLAALRDMYGDHPAAPWRYLSYGKSGVAMSERAEHIMAVVGDKAAPSLGVHPDHLAELAGYKSGDEMVRAILVAEPFTEAVAQETDTRMLERYGDISTPQALARAAEKAVFNMVRARHVATELRGLTKAIGNSHMINKAARLAAERLVASKKLRDIKPSQFVRIETKSAREAQAAQKLGDTAKAAIAKRNQLLGIHGARFAEDAVEEVERKLKYMRGAADSTAIDIEYRDQIELLLGRYLLVDLTKREQRRRVALAEWLKTHDQADIDPKLVEEAGQQHYSTMTLEEFRGLHDAVKQIDHLGRLKDRLVTIAEKRALKEKAEELGDSIRENATSAAKDIRIGEETKITALSEWGKGFLAEHRNFADHLRQMDGFKDGGPLWQAFVMSANEAADRQVEYRVKATAAYAKILDTVIKQSKIRGIGAERVHVEAVGKTFTREELIGIGLNMGNAVNRERVTTGEKWTPAQLNAVLQKLRREDIDVIKAVWKQLETYRQEMEDKQVRMLGVRPTWVEAEAFSFPGYGVVEGGYYPIAYDPKRNDRTNADEIATAAAMTARGGYIRSTTNRGHLQERADSTGLKLRYDFTRVIARHINQVTHDLAWHEYLFDASRLLKAAPVQNAIREHYGQPVFEILKNTLRDIAAGNLSAQGYFEKGAGYLKNGTGIAIMGWNLGTALQQPLGAAQAMVRVGPWNFMRALGKWAASGDVQGMDARIEEIRVKSSFMRHRGMTQNRELEDLIGQIEVGAKQSVIKDSYFYLIQAMQTWVDIPTWIAGYEVAKNANRSEATAIQLADQAVKDSQGSGLLHDKPAVMRGSQFKQLWTMFASYFLRTHSLAFEQVKIGIHNPMQAPKAVAALFALTIMPATFAALMMAALRGGDDFDDPEKLAKKLVGENLSYMLGMFMFAREAGFAVKAVFEGKAADYSGPAGGRFFASASRFIGQVAQGEVDRAMIRAARDTLGPLLHFPSTQLNRLFDYFWAQWNDKDIAPQSFITGPPSDKLK